MNKFVKISNKQYDIDFKGMCNVVKNDEIRLPSRATKFSAGYDIYSTATFELKPNESIKIPTGIKVILDDDKFLLVTPRSGLGFKYRLQLDNTVGVIDADYCNSDNEGHFWIKITNDSKHDDVLKINIGDAIAQAMIIKYEKTDDDSACGVRNGGFGSTSK